MERGRKEGRKEGKRKEENREEAGKEGEGGRNCFLLAMRTFA